MKTVLSIACPATCFHLGTVLLEGVLVDAHIDSGLVVGQVDGILVVEVGEDVVNFLLLGNSFLMQALHWI